MSFQHLLLLFVTKLETFEDLGGFQLLEIYCHHWKFHQGRRRWNFFFYFGATRRAVNETLTMSRHWHHLRHGRCPSCLQQCKSSYQSVLAVDGFPPPTWIVTFNLIQSCHQRGLIRIHLTNELYRSLNSVQETVLWRVKWNCQ